MKMRIVVLAGALAALGLFSASLLAQLPPGQEAAPRPDKPDGYTDTPMLPGGKWHVHDPNRPLPPLVKPPEKFSQMAPAPADAIVLFDGKSMEKWLNERGQPATSPIANDAFTADRAN